ncbi:MAG: helix-turn-helix domain-containing protein [Candidatus Lokiarchaeota archaeon]|nr:helix-turn-helix domain-containing protein [Candidatus Lokiarchaeota archaeon]
MKIKKMSKDLYESQGIDKIYATKEVFKAIILSCVIFIPSYLCTLLIFLLIQLDPNVGVYPPQFFHIVNLYFLIFILIVPTVTWIIGTKLYQNKYVENFSYKLTSSHLLINQGVFTKNEITIPYSRVQNINILNGIFDRKFGIYTILIETAGKSAIPSSGSGYARPEGYIPGLKDPFKFEKELKEMLDKYNVLPSGLEEKIFKPQELAFDNFVSYILTKLRDKDDPLINNVKKLREDQNITMSQLADRVGVRIETIEMLESGKYTPSLSLAYKLARELKCKIEDLFILN